MRTPAPAAVVIGASAGAIDALSAILPALPADYPLPVLIVVHIPRDRESMLAEIFATRCRLPVKEAEDKEEILGGTVYFAPPDYHLLVEPDFTISLSSDVAVLYSRPSIDVLFESAADAYGDRLAAAILTGASADGAAGMRAVCAAGGRGYAQSPATAECGTMPAAALAASPAVVAMPLAEIATALANRFPAEIS